MLLPTSHSFYFPDDIWALLLYLPSSHLLDRTCTLWSNPGEKPAWEVSSFCSLPHLYLQDLRHSYSFLKAKSTSRSPHLPDLPMPWELGLVLSCACTESFVHQHCSSHVPGPACLTLQREPTPPASLFWLCAHTDSWWPSTVKIWISRGLVSETHVFGSVIC